MTITAPGLGAPGLLSPGIGYQQGVSSGFPTPIGAEQSFGVGQYYGSQPSFWQQAPYAGHVMPQQAQQLAGQLAAQIIPVAEQIVLPPVIALAVQLVQQQVQQLMTQVVPQIMGQHPAQAWQWQQPQPFSGQQPSAFGPVARPYAGLF